MNREDKATIALLCFCLLLAFTALNSVPSTDHYPERQSWNPTAQSNDNKALGAPLLPLSKISESKDHENRSDYQPTKDYWSEIKRRLPDSVTLQTLFDFGLVIIGILQYFIYRNMRNDSLVKDRAFVCLRDLLVAWKFNPGGTSPSMEISPRWENVGSVTAFKVWLQVNIEIRPDDLPPDFEFPDRWEEGETRVRHPAFLAPHASTFGSPRTISSIDAFLLKAKQMRVFVYGWIEYDDSHNRRRRRRTEFCNEIVIYGSDQVTGQDLTRHIGYGRHNGVDGQCYRKPMPYVDPPQSTLPG